MKRVFVAAVLVCAACATVKSGVRQNYVTSRVAEYSYGQPLEEIFHHVDALLTAHELSFKRSPQDFYVETEWKQDLHENQVATSWVRYSVKGSRLDQGRNVIRVLRQTKTSAGVGEGRSLAAVAAGQANSLMHGGKVSQYQRDLGMEWELLQRIDPKAAAEIVALSKQAVDGEALPPPAASEPAIVKGPDCGAEIRGLDALLQPGTVLLLGEVHGTHEIPMFVRAAACWASQRSLPVFVGVEHPVDEAENLAGYVAGTRTREELLRGEVWNRIYQDGRTSEAMLALIDGVRELRAAGRSIDTFSFDHPALRGTHREQAMARQIAGRVAAAPGAIFLILSGNLHPRIVVGTDWDPGYDPMGHRLLAQGLKVVALDAAFGPGTGWLCTYGKKMECGERPMKGAYQGATPFIYRFPEPRNGYHGFYYVGPVRASPPAVGEGIGAASAAD